MISLAILRYIVFGFSKISKEKMFIYHFPKKGNDISRRRTRIIFIGGTYHLTSYQIYAVLIGGMLCK